MPARGIKYRRFMRARLLLFDELPLAELFAELLAARGSPLGREPGREPLDLLVDDAGALSFEEAVLVRSPLNGNGLEPSS